MVGSNHDSPRLPRYPLDDHTIRDVMKTVFNLQRLTQRKPSIELHMIKITRRHRRAFQFFTTFFFTAAFFFAFILLHPGMDFTHGFHVMCLKGYLHSRMPLQENDMAIHYRSNRITFQHHVIEENRTFRHHSMHTRATVSPS